MGTKPAGTAVMLVAGLLAALPNAAGAMHEIPANGPTAADYS
jgi:hypothetical protein